MIDTHAHLNFEAFDSDRDEVIERCFENGITSMSVPGAMLDSSKSAVELAQKHKNIFATIGLHPIHVDDEDFEIKKYKKLTLEKDVVAIGEVGLDYFHNNDLEFIKKQKEIFEQFIDLAKELNLPMILHCRGSKDAPERAYREMLESLKSKKYYKGVIHCFTSTPEIAQEFFDLGFYIGFTGVITFAKKLKPTVESIPLDKILIETDCPFMSPEPKRGERCEPWYVRYVAQRIAEIKNMKLVELIEKIDKNTKQLFDTN